MNSGGPDGVVGCCCGIDGLYEGSPVDAGVNTGGPDDEADSDWR